MTDRAKENYSEYPKQYICAGKDYDPTTPAPDYIQVLGLCFQVYLIGNDGMYYLDLLSSQESTGYIRWLDMLSEEDRVIELANDLSGGGAH